MNMQQVVLTMVGATVSLILAMALLWYSKKTITKTMSRRHILHMLKSHGMNSAELAVSAKESRSTVISPKLVPSMLVKLQEEGLIQRAGNNMYVITTKGLESIQNLDSMGKELQKVARIVQKTSVVGKFMVTEAFDWIAGVKDGVYKAYADDSQNAKSESAVPIYGADKNRKSAYNLEGGGELEW